MQPVDKSASQAQPSFTKSLVAFVLSTTGVSALLMLMQAPY
ncbi:hypothetical protein [Microvirga pudoricolor]|nr:hypothetical protein [Microvirga pudoricolor]